MFLYFIVALIVGYMLIQLFYNKKSIKKAYYINVLIILIYNLIGWGYTFNYLDAGGASLGPGLMLLFLTGVHIGILILYVIIRSFADWKKQEGLN
jgi:hypothetical protein